MIRRMSFTAKAHCWALAIGCTLVLVALLALAHAGRAAERIPAQEPYARVLETVTRLGGCPTCHATPASQEPGVMGALLASAPLHRAIELPDARPAAAKTQAAQVNERLVAVGQRLLDALPSGDARAGQAAASYLTIVTDIGAGGSPAALVTALAQLEQLEAVLRTLEREAGTTVFWQASEPLTASAGAATVALTSVSPAAVLIGVGFVLLAVAQAGERCAPGKTDCAPAQVAFAFSRRGPPSATAFRFGAERRLPPLSVQSSFCCKADV